MTTPTIREALHTSGSGSGGLSVVTGAGTEVDDILLTFHGSNYYDAGAAGVNMVSPSGSAGTWTPIEFVELGVNNTHLKAWWRPVTVAGAQTVTITPLNDENKFNVTLVIDSADTTSPVDAHANATASSTASPAAPSVSPTSSDALLVCAAMSAVFTTPNYSAPGSMTERSEDHDSASLTTATEALASSGATGTRTFSADLAVNHVLLSIAIQAGSSTVEATLDATAPAATAATTVNQIDSATLDATAPAATAATAVNQANSASVVAAGAAATATTTVRQTNYASVVAIAAAATAAFSQTGLSTVVPVPRIGTIARPDTGTVEVPRLVYP